MKVFLSWSEHRSRLAAEAFKSWIEEVLQCVEPWMSPDIDKGANWPSELSDRLATTSAGVVFLAEQPGLSVAALRGRSSCEHQRRTALHRVAGYPAN